MKKTIKRVKSVLKGVSTLDIMIRNSRFIFLLLISMAALAGAANGGHSTLDVVDPSFTPRIETLAATCKFVDQIVVLPDGKMVVAGKFNTYNRQPIGGLVRLNADGTLDTTFNSNLPSGSVNNMVVQTDGKIVIITNPYGTGLDQIIRLNADGTNDTTFHFSYSTPQLLALDAAGRIIVAGSFFVGNGYTSLIRLNSNGNRDQTFVYPLGSIFQANALATQGNKIIFAYVGNSATIVERVNENGMIDPSFVTRNFFARRMILQPDGKILLLDSIALRRLDQDGSDDTAFTVTTFPANQVLRWGMGLSDDGKITVAEYSGSAQDHQIRKFLPDGTEDGSFTPYNAVRVSAIAVQPDGSVLIGDGNGACISIPLSNDFVRLFPNGSPDGTFNTGGIGFQAFGPSSIKAIDVQPDGKILIGGLFHIVNDVPRYKLARVNPDSTIDLTFNINNGGAGHFNYINWIEQIRSRSDGKIVVKGSFTYVLNGITRQGLVRLNSDGSIDPTFDLRALFDSDGRFETFSDGKLLLATKRQASGTFPVPLKITAEGERDTTFNPDLFPGKYVDARDVAIQPDGKILVGGFFTEYVLETGTNIYKSFLTRLNADGSLDTTFQTREQLDKQINAFVLQPNGKIVVAESTIYFINPSQTNVLRLNPDGSVDPTFNAGTGPDGSVNAMLLLSTGRIFVGGRFTTFNGQSRANLVQLNTDGSVFTPDYQLNDEVLCLAVDADGRVFVGGNFTTIIAGSSGGPRSNVAGLIDARQGRPRFDFDGDGRSDISVFRPSDRVWYLDRSTEGFTALQFGLSSDKIVPADYDGDGKTDIAVYRPSSGVWYVLSTENGTVANYQFGIAEDMPAPGDLDGDGKADLSVFRPSTGDWYTRHSGDDSFHSVQFGINGDSPTVGDFDGDGKADIGVYRSSDTNWYRINSSDGSFHAEQLGNSTDLIVPADYDGDGRTDIAVYRPSGGYWYIKKSATGTYSAVQFGLATDNPAPGDFDGDGKADVSVFRPSDGTWYRTNSSNGSFSAFQFGTSGDKPTMTAFRY